MKRTTLRDAAPVLAVWACFSLMLICISWHRISTLAFSDPDDAMRLKQVLDLLRGQSWWDLRQYAVDPPAGTDMHWSRLVDIPLLAILRPALALTDRDGALRIACTAAPLIPMLAAMFATAHAVRRLVDRNAGTLGTVCLGMSTISTVLWTPLRIDHHGWQIALSCVALASLVGERTWRAGAVCGTACALSLSIGMEASPVMAVAAAVVVVQWIDTGRADEMRAFGLALFFLLPTGYELLQPRDNAQALCDALTPVWTTDGALGGALLAAASTLRGSWRSRAAIAAAAVAAVVVHHAVRWPGCQLPTDSVGPLAQRIWLSGNSETRPLLAAPWPYVANLAIPCGLSAVVMWDALGTDRWRRWSAPAGMFCVMLAVSLWRIRGTAILQAVSVPGVAYLVHGFVHRRVGEGRLPHVVRTIAAPVAATGMIVTIPTLLVAATMQPDPVTAARTICFEGTRLERLDTVPGDMVLATLNMSPYVAAFTRHRVLAGPYHRDADGITNLILDWHEPPARAHADAMRRGVSIVVACPAAEPYGDPNSFQDRLARNDVPWLVPMDVPGIAPLRAWRVVEENAKRSGSR